MRLSRGTLLGWVTFVALSILALPGCSDDDDDNPVNPAPSTQLTGTFASPGEGGRMTITVQAGSLAPARRSAGTAPIPPISASAVLAPEIGPSIEVTGTYGEESDTLILSGGGYNLIGVYDVPTDAIRGSYMGPKGQGRFVCAMGGASEIGVFCGTFRDDDDVTRGRWNLVTTGTQLWGIGALHSWIFYQFEGTVSGAGATKTISVDDQAVGNGHDLIADGTLDTGTGLGQGTWTSSAGGITINTGPWSVAPCETSGQLTELTGASLGDVNGLLTIAIGSNLPLAPRRPAPSLGAHEVPATARLVALSETVSGFYNPETDSLNLVGKPLVSMHGEYDDTGPIPTLTGRYTGGGGEGPFIATVGGTIMVKPLCGSFENQDQTTSGPWALLVAGTSATGMAVTGEGAELRFQGTVTGTGTTRTITLAGSDGQGGTLTATGTLDTTTYTVTNGAWSIEIDSTPMDDGTWSGELCPGAAP